MRADKTGTECNAADVLFLSVHAVKQGQRRDITRTEVAQALARADTTYASKEYPAARTVVLGTTDQGRRLKIVVLTDDAQYVVTVADRDGEE